MLRSRAGTSRCSSGLPNPVSILMNSPLIELSVSRLPRSSGPIRPGESSKLLGVAASAGPALLVTVLKAIVGRALSSWIGARETSCESTSTCPPP